MFAARRHAAVSRALLGLSIPLLAAGGCGGGGDGAPPAFLSLGTAPPGGAFFVVGGALAEVLGEARSPGHSRSDEGVGREHPPPGIG